MSIKSKEIAKENVKQRIYSLIQKGQLDKIISHKGHEEIHHDLSDENILLRLVAGRQKGTSLGHYQSISTFRNAQQNYSCLEENLLANADAIAEWYVNEPNIYAKKFTIDMAPYQDDDPLPGYKPNEPIGTGWATDYKKYSTTIVRMVLCRDNYNETGFYVKTNYPDIQSDPNKKVIQENGQEILHQTEYYKNAAPMHKIYMDTLGETRNMRSEYNPNNDTIYYNISDENNLHHKCAINKHSVKWQSYYEDSYSPYTAKPAKEFIIPPHATDTVIDILKNKNSRHYAVDYITAISQTKLDKKFKKEREIIDKTVSHRDIRLNNLIDNIKSTEDAAYLNDDAPDY